jgi:hypothetical protein
MTRTRSTLLTALALGTAALLAAPARTAELDRLTPADAQMVVTFNLRQVVDSPLAKKKGLVQLIKDQLDKNEEAKTVLMTIGLDPFKDIQSVAIAMPIPENPGGKVDKGLFIIRGNFDQDKIEAAMKKEPTTKTSKEGTRTIFEMKGKGNDTDTGFVTFADKSTIVAAPSKEYLLTSLKAAKPNPALAKSVGTATGKESVWMGLILTDAMKKQMAQNPMSAAFGNLDSITTTVNVTDAILIDVNLNADNAANAGKIKPMIDQFVQFFAAFGGADEKTGPIVKKVLANLKTSVKGNAVNINVKITEDVVDDLIKLGQMK